MNNHSTITCIFYISNLWGWSNVSAWLIYLCNIDINIFIYANKSYKTKKCIIVDKELYGTCMMLYVYCTERGCLVNEIV